MKTTMLLAAATAALLLTLGTASAAEPLHTPKGKVLADSLARVPGTTPDMIDRSLPAASPKELAARASLARIGGSEADHLNRDVSSVSPRLAVKFPEVAAHARMLRGSK